MRRDARLRLLRGEPTQGKLGRARQGEIEGAARAHLALDPDHAAVGFDDAFRDRQTESDPAPIRGHGLPEAPENVRQLVGRDSRSVVGDTELYSAIDRLGAD